MTFLSLVFMLAIGSAVRVVEAFKNETCQNLFTNGFINMSEVTFTSQKDGLDAGLPILNSSSPWCRIIDVNDSLLIDLGKSFEISQIWSQGSNDSINVGHVPGYFVYYSVDGQAFLPILDEYNSTKGFDGPLPIVLGVPVTVSVMQDLSQRIHAQYLVIKPVSVAESGIGCMRIGLTACFKVVNGGFTVWGSWSYCSVSCGNGTQIRHRTCSNPVPAYGGEPCTGSYNETKNCTLSPCNEKSDYGEWSTWSKCSETCEADGFTTRKRTCENLSIGCTGPNVESKKCGSAKTACLRSNTEITTISAIVPFLAVLAAGIVAYLYWRKRKRSMTVNHVNQSDVKLNKRISNCTSLPTITS